MRSIVRLGWAFIIIATIDVGAAPPVLAQSSCQCVCRYDQYGRRQCRQVCTYPRYVPAPRQDYSPQYYYTPSPSTAAPFSLDLSPLIAIAVLGVIIAVIVAAFLQSSNTADLITETDSIRADTAATRSHTEQTRAQTRDLEDAFEARAQQSYAHGRAAADEAWDRIMEDRRG